jgi:hypothetical protein
MDQSPKPAIHSNDLRMKYSPGCINGFWVDVPRRVQSPFGKTIEVKGAGIGYHNFNSMPRLEARLITQSAIFSGG